MQSLSMQSIHHGQHSCDVLHTCSTASKFVGGEEALSQMLQLKFLGLCRGLVATWPATLVRNGRQFTWPSDEEVCMHVALHVWSIAFVSRILV